MQIAKINHKYINTVEFPSYLVIIINFCEFLHKDISVDHNINYLSELLTVPCMLCSKRLDHSLVEAKALVLKDQKCRVLHFSRTTSHIMLV